MDEPNNDADNIRSDETIEQNSLSNFVDSVCGGCIDNFVCANAQEEEISDEDNEATADSDLSDPNRRIWIVTTASLPWRTGTAVNPLLRALYLARNRPDGYVTLVIPWLTKRKHRVQLYGEKFAFDGENNDNEGDIKEYYMKKNDGMKQQEMWIRQYAEERCNAHEEAKKLQFLFYPSLYKSFLGSIFPTIDICELIPDSLADIAILEEPEHLNWFRVPSSKRNLLVKSDIDSDVENGDKVISDSSPTDEDDDEEKKELGWAQKFKHVVGIIHTNYAEYAKQNGLSAALVGVPTISIASALVVRAYCHKVIKLSPVLPNYAPGKETTENVHGVRSEFLQGKYLKKNGREDEKYADIYFIGKLLWAKGFDIMLDIQECYRRSTRSYFPIDIYGTGPDEKHIGRALLGRKGHNKSLSPSPLPRFPTSTNDNIEQSTKISEKKKILVLDRSASLRSQVSFDSNHDNDDDKEQNGSDKRQDPLSILYDTAEKSVGTATATTKAMYHLADSAIKNGLELTFSFSPERSEHHTEGDYPEGKEKLVFDPPKSRFELRRQPIPAIFYGVKDHAEIKDLPYKAFFNPSVSEVLCTTTAEALAMGKFVIIPDHPSNQFFLQFSNCLSYKTHQECVRHIEFVLDASNHPKPLTQEEAHIFTWEAATDRLIKASIITVKERREREALGHKATDDRIAWFHSKGGKVGKLFKKTDGDISKHSNDK